MKYATFEATSPFEVGDKVKIDGIVKEITDICLLNYCKSGLSEFTYELDNSRAYVQLESKEKG